MIKCSRIHIQIECFTTISTVVINCIINYTIMLYRPKWIMLICTGYPYWVYDNTNIISNNNINSINESHTQSYKSNNDIAHLHTKIN